MNNSHFEQLIRKRESWVRSSRENDFDFEEILAGPYKDPSHFIYELLQNAEDESANKIIFKLYGDRLEIWHDGEDFSLQDVEKITGIGKSNKPNEPGKIGKFGVGFKSVFAITQTPFVQSGEFCFKIRDFVVPEPLSLVTATTGTIITLPFDHKIRNRNEIYALVQQRLKGLGLDTLLFLSHIRNIEWVIGEESGFYRSQRSLEQPYSYVERVILDSKTDSCEYLVFWRTVEEESVGARKVEVAYKLERHESKYRIVGIPKSKLFAYFSTEVETHLEFAVQGPYNTTHARDNIKEKDAWNDSLLEKTAELVADSLLTIKEMNLLDGNFISLLPLEPVSSSKIESEIAKHVLQKIESYPILPTADGVHARAEEILIAGEKRLAQLLSNDDLAVLFKRTYWLHASMGSFNTSYYLKKNANLVEVGAEDFVKLVTPDFLKTKSDEWIIQFYRFLGEKRSLWQALKTKAFIRQEDDSHVAPFDSNDNRKAYLPTSDTTRYPIVKRVIAQDEECAKFLKDFGLREPNTIDEINEFIIPRYASRPKMQASENYFDDFETLMKGLDRDLKLRDSLQKIPFILSLNAATHEAELRTAEQVYLLTNELQELFGGNENIYFVASELYERFGDDRVCKALKLLGATDYLKRIPTDTKISDEQRKKWRDGTSGKNEKVDDYTFDELEWILAKISKRTSPLLWDQILRAVENQPRWSSVDVFFQGRYSWYYRTGKYKTFDAHFMQTLRTKPWVLTKGDELKSPTDITLSELSDLYETNSRVAKILIEKLQFKPDIKQQYLRQLPEDKRRVLGKVDELESKGVQLDEIENALATLGHAQKLSPNPKDSAWNPTHKPEELPTRIIEHVPSQHIPITTPAVLGSSGAKDAIVESQGQSSTSNNTRESNKAKIDDIGSWGERYVFQALRNEYNNHGSLKDTNSGFNVTTEQDARIEVAWLNRNGEVGKGCDFVVRIDGQDRKYIEVKTKSHDSPQYVEITGTQWELAQQADEKYWIYVVSNAGTLNAKIVRIHNPFKLWQEGKILAHPVSIKL